MAKPEEMKAKVERYKKLLADKAKAGAGPDRIRLFRKKLKRAQRRLRRLAPKKAAGKEGAEPPKEAAAAPAAEKK